MLDIHPFHRAGDLMIHLRATAGNDVLRWSCIFGSHFLFRSRGFYSINDEDRSRILKASIAGVPQETGCGAVCKNGTILKSKFQSFMR